MSFICIEIDEFYMYRERKGKKSLKHQLETQDKTRSGPVLSSPVQQGLCTAYASSHRSHPQSIHSSLTLIISLDQTLQNTLIMQPGSRKLRRPIRSHKIPNTRHTLSVIGAIGNDIIVALEIIDHLRDEVVDDVLITTGSPVCVVDAGEFRDPDGFAKGVVVVFDDLDAFGGGGLVDVDRGDVPGAA